MEHHSWNMALRMCSLAAWLCLGASHAAGPFATRQELLKPLGAEAEAALSKYVDGADQLKLDSLTAHMDHVIEEIGKVVKLEEAEVTKLQQDAKPVIEAAAKAWKVRVLASLRSLLPQYGDDSTQAKRVGVWKPEQLVPTYTVEAWKLPERTPAWNEVLKKQLGDARMKIWLKADAARQAELAEKLGKYLERWASNGRVPMDEALRLQIESMKKALKLSQDKVDQLFKAAKELVDGHVAAEIVAGRDLMESLIDAQRDITLEKPTAMATRFVRPKGTELEAKWAEIAGKQLGAEAMVVWQKAAAEQKAKEEKEIVDALKPSEQQARFQLEEQMLREVDGYVSSLNLSDERKKELEKLSKQAVDASMAQAKKSWMKTVSQWSAVERQQGRRNSYFGVNDTDKPMKLPIWQDGLKKLFTAEETLRVKDGVDFRKKRMSGALASATLTEMDKMLSFDESQRKALEPLILEFMEPLMREEGEDYWSYQPYQLFKALEKVDEKKLQTILDEEQMKLWKKLITMQPQNSGRGIQPAVPSNNTTNAVPVDVEREISRHLHQMGIRERERLQELMLARVKDASRVLKLAPEKVARLTTAAKGAVEHDMDEWRNNVENWVRNAVQRATPNSIKQTLASMERTSYGNSSKGAQNQPIWMEVQDALLSEQEHAKWQKVCDERQEYRVKAMAMMTVNELDRRRRLNQTQVEKVSKLVADVLKDYHPDIERYMSGNWFLQYYYALLPLAGVKEADMKAVLTEQQWKQWRERDMPDPEQYWEGIESYHKQRIKGESNEE